MRQGASERPRRLSFCRPRCKPVVFAGCCRALSLSLPHCPSCFCALPPAAAMTKARGEPMQDKTPDLYRDVLGIDLPSERLTEILRLYADILGAVMQLRALDLTQVHPAVIFDPASGQDEAEA